MHCKHLGVQLAGLSNKAYCPRCQVTLPLSDQIRRNIFGIPYEDANVYLNLTYQQRGLTSISFGAIRSTPNISGQDSQTQV